MANSYLHAAEELAPLCSPQSTVCAKYHASASSPDTTYPIGDLIDAYYRKLAPHVENDNGQTRFSTLSRVYEKLTKNKAGNVSDNDKRQVVAFLESDIKARENLYQFALSRTEKTSFWGSTELGHYVKELRYLKSLQSLNERQIQQMKALDSQSPFLFDLVRQKMRLDIAVRTIAISLERDLSIEKQLLRYFMLSNRGANEN
ncbi:MAG: hypothetical protein ACK5NL_04645 [Vibrio fluvialis]